jgi:hypothetical protein
MIPFILKSSSISLFPVGGEPIIIDYTHVNFNAVADAIREGRWDDALEMASVSNYINSVSAGNVRVDETGLYYKDMPLTGYLANKLTQFFNEGLLVEHYCAFVDNLMNNPSMVSRNELFLFLEAANLPVTDDGCFLAYKAVTNDYKDHHTGSFDNSPGVTHSMPRREVDDNRERTCSYGFHAAAYDYAKSFGGQRIVAVKINPADVVSVPSDYNNQKLRCCKYTVAFEIENRADTLTGRAYYSPAAEPVFDAEENSYFWGAIWNDDGDADDYDSDGNPI